VQRPVHQRIAAAEFAALDQDVIERVAHAIAPLGHENARSYAEHPLVSMHPIGHSNPTTSPVSPQKSITKIHQCRSR